MKYTWINKNELRDIVAKAEDLKRRLRDAEEKLNAKDTEVVKSSVIVYLKNDKVLRIYDADEFIYDDDYVFIYKDDDFVASVKKEDVIAISTNPISVDEPVYYYTHNGSVERM